MTVLPGGATTVVPLCDGAMTVDGEALGAGTMTVCASAGTTDAAMRPSPSAARVIRRRVMTFLLWTQGGPKVPLRNPDAGDPSGVLTPPRVTATVGTP